MGLEIPLGIIIKAPILPERYAPSELHKTIIPHKVLILFFGVKVETSEYNKVPILIRVNFMLYLD